MTKAGLMGCWPSNLPTTDSLLEWIAAEEKGVVPVSVHSHKPGLLP